MGGLFISIMLKVLFLPLSVSTFFNTYAPKIQPFIDKLNNAKKIVKTPHALPCAAGTTTTATGHTSETCSACYT